MILFQNVACFCLPSDSENFGLSAFELANLGLQTLVSQNVAAFEKNAFPNVRVLDTNNINAWVDEIYSIFFEDKTTSLEINLNYLQSWINYAQFVSSFVNEEREMIK